MSQKTDLNVTPYYDDFSEDSQYHRILFRPGYAVQARELTQLQTIFQNQIERFGKHIFKEGAIVIPGGVTYDHLYYAIKLDYINHLKIEPILCEENTLIITNNMGCHKRGRLSPWHSRKLIRIIFYDQQLPFYKRLISGYIKNKREKKVVKKLEQIK